MQAAEITENLPMSADGKLIKKPPQSAPAFGVPRASQGAGAGAPPETTSAAKVVESWESFKPRLPLAYILASRRAVKLKHS